MLFRRANVYLEAGVECVYTRLSALANERAASAHVRKSPGR